MSPPGEQTKNNGRSDKRGTRVDGPKLPPAADLSVDPP